MKKTKTGGKDDLRTRIEMYENGKGADVTPPVQRPSMSEKK